MDYLVKIRSVQTPLNGQFSIGANSTLAQYVGRLHRLHHLKTEVRIYDYVDIKVPMLSKMSEKRKVGYKALGYKMVAEEL